MALFRRHVHSVAKSGSAQLQGDVTLSQGSNITLTQSGQDISIAASGSGGGDSVSKAFNQAAHGFAVGDAIATDNSGAWVKADASDIDLLGIAIVSAVADVDNFTAVFSGYISTLSGLTADEYYFVDASTPGLLTATEPSDPNYSNPLLLALSTTTGIVLPYRPSESGGGGGGGAPTDASYVVIGSDATLTDERTLTGTSNQIVVTDGGAGSTVTLSTPQNIHTGASPTFAGLTLSSPLTVANGGTGLATLTANNVMLGNGASNVAFVAPGTSGNVLTSNGTTWTSTAASSGPTVKVVGTAETRTSTTLSASSTLTVTPTWGATTRYAVYGVLLFSNANATPDADFQFQGPAVTTLNIAYQVQRHNSTSIIAQEAITAFATGGTAGALVNMNAGVVHAVTFYGGFITTGTPGSNPFQVEFAQNVGDGANATSLLTGSHFILAVAN